MPATEENREAIRQFEIIVEFFGASQELKAKDRLAKLGTGPLARFVHLDGNLWQPYYEQKPRVHEAGTQ